MVLKFIKVRFLKQGLHYSMFKMLGDYNRRQPAATIDSPILGLTSLMKEIRRNRVKRGTRWLNLVNHIQYSKNVK